MNTVADVVSRNGFPIRITYKQWAHIVDSHDYMSGNLDLVLETIESPDFLVGGWTDEVIALKHYKKTNITEKYVIVIYAERGQDGFVITSFMTSKAEKIMKRGIIWKR